MKIWNKFQLNKIYKGSKVLMYFELKFFPSTQRTEISYR